MGWLQGWAKRVKITIDSGDVDANLTWFPVLVRLSSSCGINSADLTCVFKELGSKSKKIAVTQADGVTQLYVEIEEWDATNEVAWLWVSKTGWTILAASDTTIYLYYDRNKPDNTSFVGDINSTPGANVWDSNFMLVLHMKGSAAVNIDDSTSNNNDITGETGAPAYDQAGKVSKAVDLERGTTDSLQVASPSGIGNKTQLTVETWINNESSIGNIEHRTVLCYYNTANNKRSWFDSFYKTGGICYFYFYTSNDGVNIAYSRVVFEPNNGQWYHTVWTFHGTNGVDFWLDGSEVALQTEGFRSKVHDPVTPLDIGLRTYSTPTREWDGLLDEIRVSDVVRPDAYLKANYETQRDHLLTFGQEIRHIIWKLKDRGGDARTRATFGKLRL